VLASEAPRVTLRTAPMVPFDGAIAAARTCYSPRVIGTAEITDSQRDTIGALTFDAGHHTVYQHANFEFGLENISRQFVWAFLHSYPFYNSEQSSQRYVKLKEPRAFVPPIAGEALDVYESAVLRAWDRYAELSDLLKDDAFSILKDLRYVRPTTTPERLKLIDKDAGKRAIETARYVIPIGAFTSMVHTVSGIVLHRLYRMMQSGDTPYEARLVISEMVRLVKEWDPLFFDKVGAGPLSIESLPEEGFPRPRGGGDAFAMQFDARLNGRWSRLRDTSLQAESVVAEAVRAVFGLLPEELSDDEAIDRVMNPARNSYRLDVLNVAHHSPLMRSLHHATYVFEKRLSHTADSQDQRHRMVPASRPMLTFADTERPDYITPRLIAANPRARAIYDEAMRESWDAKNRLLGLGVPLEFALYVLPNAKTLRFVESGSLLSLLHKWTMRTCFNAQEEIYLASMDEVEQVRAVHPAIGRHIGPPCVIRNGLISPRCTEGSHFCGVPVWRDFPAVVRRL
jgi:thymidylate synthase ThyX